jgi:predicted DNA-binding protein with PD1-like motif
MRWLVPSIPAAVLSMLAPACATTGTGSPTLQVGWVAPSQAGPRGEAPGAQSRLIGAEPDGVKFYVLVLREGDEVATGLARFAHDQAITNAHFVAIGAVRAPQVAWFDVSRGEYRSIARQDQLEVLTLSGDIALGTDGQPVVHAHMVLGGRDGSAWGGHLLSATVSPTLEVYVTSFPTPLHKRLDPATKLQLIDPSIIK